MGVKNGRVLFLRVKLPEKTSLSLMTTETAPYNEKKKRRMLENRAILTNIFKKRKKKKKSKRYGEKEIKQ